MGAAVLIFRFKQLGKIIREIPLLYLLLILGMLGFAGIYLFSAIKDRNAAIIISLLFLFLIFLVQDRRRDYRFMHIIAEYPVKVFCLEYLLLSIPLLFVLSIHGHWIIAGSVFSGIVLIALKRQGNYHVKSGFTLPGFVPYSLFEIRCGARRYGLFLFVLYLIAWGTLPFPYVSLAVFWLLTLSLADLFGTSEPVNILCTPELPPAKFLHRKLKINLLAFLCVITPLCLVYLLVHPEAWWFSLYYLIAMTTNIALVIASKYAHYSPGEKIMGGQIAIIISFFCVAVPILYPLILFYLIKNYLAARRNLKTYLDAYDTELACRIQ